MSPTRGELILSQHINSQDKYDGYYVYHIKRWRP
jgi:hypothetical protein